MVDSTTADNTSPDRDEPVELRQQDARSKISRCRTLSSGRRPPWRAPRPRPSAANLHPGQGRRTPSPGRCPPAPWASARRRHVRGHRHDAVAGDAVDEADACSACRSTKLLIGPSRMASAPAARRSDRDCAGPRETHQDVDRLVAAAAGIRRLDAVGDELKRGTDGRRNWRRTSRLRPGRHGTFQSMPGSGQGRRRDLGCPSASASIAATFLAAAGSSSGSRPPSGPGWACRSAGPARGAVTSTRMPGISAVAVRMPSMISCAERACASRKIRTGSRRWCLR